MHWYARDGRAVHQVEMKSRPGQMRDTTLGDARKLGLAPGVTDVLRVMAAPGLERWKIREGIKAARLLASRMDYQSDDALIADALVVSMEEARAKAKLGTEIHADISLAVGGAGCYGNKEIVRGVLDMLGTLGFDWMSEVAFCVDRFGKLYGGTIDLIGANYNGGTIVLDIKTKEVIDDKTCELYDEHLAQAALYAMALSDAIAERYDAGAITAVGNLFVGYDGSLKLAMHTPEQRERGIRIGLACLELWYAKTGLTHGDDV